MDKSTDDLLGDGPVVEKFEKYMKALARVLDADWPDAAFILMMTDFNKDGRESRVSYISNIDRNDVVTLMAEQLQRFKDDGYEGTRNAPQRPATDAAGGLGEAQEL